MALVVADRVKESTTTTGTGTVNLAGAETGFQTFVAGIGNSNTTYYAIVDSNTGDFEVGIGTVTDASPDTLSRDTILQSSNSDSAVNFGSGTKSVFCTLPADKAVFEDASGNISIPGTIDGRDLATDGTKLDGIESNATADQTASEIRALVESATDSNVFTDADHSKLNGIEASADVTDATNVTAAGALMDSEVTNLAQVKAFDSSDYATAAQGTTADNALPKAGGTMTGDLTGTQATTSASWTVLQRFFANPAAESGEQTDVRLINDLAGFNKWGTETLTDIVTSHQGSTAITTLGDSAYDGTSSTKNIYKNANNDPNVILLELPHALTYSCWVGIVFGATNWRTKSVKIETFRNGAWQTECDLTNQSSHIVARQVSGNNANGVTKIRYTLDDYQNTSSNYARIHTLFAVNYRAGNNAEGGVHYLSRFKDDEHYSNIAPALDSTYALGTTSKRYSNVYSDALDVAGNITVSGTVDGRDLATDGTKLDGIESNATADQTKSDIDALGINADQVDGIEASQFLRSDAADTATGLLTLTGGINVLSGTGGGKLRVRRNTSSTDGDDITDIHMDDAGINIDIDNDNDGDSGRFLIRRKVDGSFTNTLAVDPSYLQYKGNTIWHAGNDGTGSGLDADTLDGVQGSSFLRSDANDSFSGDITGTGDLTADTLFADGGNLIIGDEALSSSASYVGMKTSNMSGTNDYMIISGTSDGNTYVSSKNGATTKIRGGGNAGAHELSVSSSGASFAGNLTVSGDLTVSGTTTTINTETINLADNNIVLNSNHTGTPTQNAGITIERGTSTDKVFQWNESSDYWETDDDFQVSGDITATGTINSTLATRSDLFTGATYPSNSYLDFDDDQSLVSNATTLASIGNTNILLDTNNNGATDKLRIAKGSTDIDSATVIASFDSSGFDVTGNITVSGTVDGRDVAADGAKLDGIEASADVTDATNVTAAGALMDSEVTNLAQVKAFDSSDYATAAQGTTADAALPKTGGTMTGALTTGSNITLNGAQTGGYPSLSLQSGSSSTSFINFGTSADPDEGQIAYYPASNYMQFKAGTSTAFQVNTGGATVTGTLTADGVDVGDSEEIRLGASQDLRMYHDGTNSYVSNKTGSLYIGANDPTDVGGDVFIRAKIGENDTSIRLQDDSGIIFYSNGSVTMQSYSSFLWIHDDTTLKSSSDLLFEGGNLIFDRGTYTTTLTSDNPASANQTITFPDATGTVMLNTNLNFPFFQADGSSDTIALTADSLLPFTEADGSTNNIALTT